MTIFSDNARYLELGWTLIRTQLSEVFNVHQPFGTNPALTSAHPETTVMGVILRSKATKNLIVTGSAEILRFAQNDM